MEKLELRSERCFHYFEPENRGSERPSCPGRRELRQMIEIHPPLYPLGPEAFVVALASEV
jgi:hypothetical protein